MKKKYNYIFGLFLWSIVLLSFGGANAQNEPGFAWVKRIGNNSTAAAGLHGPVMTVDGQGNSYLAGGFLAGTYNFEGFSLAVPAGTNSGGYIAKYDPNGQIIWAKPLGNILLITSSGNQYNTDKIIVDAQGNIYLCGVNTIDAASVINDYYITPDNGGSGIGYHRTHFLAKLDADGEVLWVKTTWNPSYDYWEGVALSTNDIHFDLEGNINMTGGFRDYITFTPNDTLTTDTDDASVYLAKYSPEGDVLLNKKLSGAYPNSQYSAEFVKSDDSGNLYRWSNRGNYNPKTLYRYDALGELLDSLELDISTTGSAGYWLQGFAVSPTGDVFIGGDFKNNITLNGTTYMGESINALNSDAIVFKLTAPSYDVEWVSTYVGNGTSDSFNRLLTDELGNLYVAGPKSDAGQGRTLLRKYSGNGALLWEKVLESLYTPQTPNYGGVYATSFCQTNNGGNIWISAAFRVNAYFAEGYHFTTPSLNHRNGFLVQYGLCDTANPVIDTPATTQLCEGGSLTLSATLSDTELTYFWSTPTGTVTIEDIGTATLTVTQPGKYYLVAQEDAECYGKSQEVWVTQVALPDNEVTQEELTLTATATGEDFTYQWMIDCENESYEIPGATNQSFTPLVSGSYAVEVTNASGCSVVSECYEITVLGIKDIEQNAVALYPNPATTTLFLETPLDIKRVTIINMAGQTVLKSRNSKEIDVSALPQGYYIITAKTDKGNWKSKFVKK